jgi:hypothetical protein
MPDNKTKIKVKVTLRLTVSQSVSFSVEPHLGLMTIYLLWFDRYGPLCRGALSDERTGLSFLYAGGPCQRSLSRVRVPLDTRPYFTVSDSRLSFSLPPTTRRDTVEVFDPASTREQQTKLKSKFVQLKTPRHGPHSKYRFQWLFYCCVTQLSHRPHRGRGFQVIPFVGVRNPFPCNDRCLQSHYLKTGLHATILFSEFTFFFKVMPRAKNWHFLFV